MSQEPTITLTGNLTGDPELRYTGQGVPVANFTVASTPRNLNRQTNQWEDGEPLFVRCSVWREYGENVAESLAKGMRVLVTGRLSVRSYEYNGQQRTAIEMQVDEIGPALRYAQAQVTKVARSGQGGNPSQASQNQFSGGYGADMNNYATQPAAGAQGATQAPQTDPAGNLANVQQQFQPELPPF